MRIKPTICPLHQRKFIHFCPNCRKEIESGAQSQPLADADEARRRQMPQVIDLYAEEVASSATSRHSRDH